MAEFETLAEGYQLVEGPLPDGSGGVLFSDVLGGGVHRWSPDGVETVLPKRRGIGGLVPHADGGFVVSGRDLSLGERVLFAAPEGVHGFNDMIATDDGAILAGAMRFFPFGADEPVPTEFWRIEPDGSGAPWADGFLWPNGIGVSPDGSTVYANDYAAGTTTALNADGTGARVFARAAEGKPDGLAVDERGRVWVALGDARKVARYTPEGELEELIDVPADFVASVAFDGKDLLVATTGALLRTSAGTEGRPIPAATVSAAGPS